jgi:hypothetical protein
MQPRWGGSRMGSAPPGSGHCHMPPRTGAPRQPRRRTSDLATDGSCSDPAGRSHRTPTARRRRKGSGLGSTALFHTGYQPDRTDQRPAVLGHPQPRPVPQRAGRSEGALPRSPRPRGLPPANRRDPKLRLHTSPACVHDPLPGADPHPMTATITYTGAQSPVSDGGVDGVEERRRSCRCRGNRPAQPAERGVPRFHRADREMASLLEKLSPQDRTWLVVIDGIGGVGKMGGGQGYSRGQSETPGTARVSGCRP